MSLENRFRTLPEGFESKNTCFVLDTASKAFLYKLKHELIKAEFIIHTRIKTPRKIQHNNNNKTFTYKGSD